jgi:hypothetical protein
MLSKLEENVELQADAHQVPNRLRSADVELHVKKWLLSAFIVVSSLQSVAQGGTPRMKSILIATDGKPKASIVVGGGEKEGYAFAAAELQRYLLALSGAQLEIFTDGQVSSRSAQQPLILLGGQKVNKMVSEAVGARLVDFGNLKTDGFVIKTTRLRNRPVVILGGSDDTSTMYAVYELIERLGVTFTLTGDLIPPKQANLSIPAMDLRMEPSFARRGFLLQDAGYENVTLFSYADYAKFTDQMAKMKCNYLQIWWFPFTPWLKYSYKGESKLLGDVATKESGYLDWALGGFGSRTTDDVSIGKERFHGRRLAPPELQTVETPDEAFAIAQDLMRRVIHHAKERHIKVWLAVEEALLPPNLARYCERLGALPFGYIAGTWVQPLDPVNREIQVNRLKALIDTYPEAEGYFLVFSEGYPEPNTAKYGDFFNRERPKFHELRRLFFPWRAGWALDADRVVDNTIGNFDLFQYLLKKRDEIAPQVKIGLMGVGRGYALPLLDKMLPKDVPFSDMESSGVWTPLPVGLPLEDFGGMGTRERILQPRVDDDVDMVGMQFNVTQYSAQDRIFTDGIKYGLTGFAGQVNRARGTEVNSSSLAKAAWSPQLTPQEFYTWLSTHAFGQAAATDMYRAFMKLEENQQYMGYGNYGYTTMFCCEPKDGTDQIYKYFLQKNPFDGPNTPEWEQFIKKAPDFVARFEGSIHLLDEALENLRSALPKAAPQGKYELEYITNKTQSYRDYIQAVLTFREACLSFDRAFKERKQMPYEKFQAALGASLGTFELAGQQVQRATHEFSEFVDHPSDLGVLYELNARGVLSFELSRQWIEDIVNFHKGKGYLKPVPFDRIYSSAPYHPGPADPRNID